MAMSDLAIALIIGCARSGTSILGELVAAHPRVSFLFEAHAVWRVAGPGPDESHRLVAAHATPSVRTQIREWFQRQRGAGAIVVEKNPRHILRIPFIRAVFPEARIIHVIRDGRDVACSLMPGIGGNEWRHLKPPSWRSLLSTYSGVERCALAWKEILEIALEDLADVPHLEVRYEHLVEQPQQEAAAIVQYLGLPEAPQMLAFCRNIQDTTVRSYQAKRQSKWYRDDHERRTGRWRKNLTATQQAAIQTTLEPLLRRLGYQ